MVSPTNDKPPRIGAFRAFPVWAVILIALLTFSGFAWRSWQFAKRDDTVIPREQVASGQIYEISKGKGHPVSYSFSYQGEVFRGQESCDSAPKVGDTITVYFDSVHPTTNSLTDYRGMSAFHHKAAVSLSRISAVLAVSLIFAIAVKGLRSSTWRAGPSAWSN